MQQLSPYYFFAALEKMRNLMPKRSILCIQSNCTVHAFKAIALQSENNIVNSPFKS